jgi:DNA polymerase I
MEKILLIDSNNLLHRVFWIHKSYANRASVPQLFLNSIKKYYNMFNPDITYMAWDSKIFHGQTNFRKTECIEYKQTRDRAKDDEIYKHEKSIKDLCESLGIRNICPGVLEADDVIHWLCTHYKNHEKVVVSVDQDLVQLVNENTMVFSPIKDIQITVENFEAVMKVPLDSFVAYKALVGDKSDNIVGVPRVGTKTALKILSSSDSVKDSLKKDDYFIFEKNLDLVDLSKALSFHPSEEDVYIEQLNKLDSCTVDFDKFKDLCTQYQLNNTLNAIDSWRTVFTKNDFIKRLQSFLNEK